ncbi:MAG: uroporphyrinogen-III synthase [Burkholderiales bacterium]
MKGGGGTLSNKGIVITRPAEQSEHLATLVREHGGNPILFPALEILPLENREPLLQIFSRLAQFDFAIFISSNSVNHSLAHLPGGWPENVQTAAIGAGTLHALEAFGISKVIVPKDSADSEALLQALEQVSGKRVVIFRGQGGRELLKETLIARGAVVEYAECYRRAIPKLDPAPLIELWSRSRLHAVTVNSGEALRNLFEMLPSEAQSRLRKTPLFTPHPRLAAVARGLGCAQVTTTAPGDEGLIAGLGAYFGTRI